MTFLRNRSDFENLLARDSRRDQWILCAAKDFSIHDVPTVLRYSPFHFALYAPGLEEFLMTEATRSENLKNWGEQLNRTQKFSDKFQLLQFIFKFDDKIIQKLFYIKIYILNYPSDSIDRKLDK